ncbi:aryl-hydrocarbon-interacting protein-like 1 [Tachyglossus aculeatus]|uniref:aryl-hydrocarbon-interacting protein-like 1 n=1 Tax=Tachyglossus aculeatus TaxID=9261 RepID=UPI0018F2D661|nr:aryl-hydrocarbon-interacting protein-like 1 [Tachyglossus aculeatus]
MDEIALLGLEGIRKKILHGGLGELPAFHDGSKVTFHFMTLKDDAERTVIDDSRRAGAPAELVVGKLFKMEVWETLLTSMRLGEVAEFWCDAVHTGLYALVSRSVRRIAEGRDPAEGQRHRCGMGNLFDYHSTGYGDLDELQRSPRPLIFVMELLKVEAPWSYKRDTWAMNPEEKLQAVPLLHAQGNRLVLQRKFGEAAAKYQEAVVCLRTLQAKEKPLEASWCHLEGLLTPLILNYCQCQLELGDHYEVLQHTTALLQKDPGNVKAYFKRAKAHAAVWDEEEARADFLRAARLDPTLAAAVKEELRLLGERMRRKRVEERHTFRGLFRRSGPKEPGAGHQEGVKGAEIEEGEWRGQARSGRTETRRQGESGEAGSGEEDGAAGENRGDGLRPKGSDTDGEGEQDSQEDGKGAGVREGAFGGNKKISKGPLPQATASSISPHLHSPPSGAPGEMGLGVGGASNKGKRKGKTTAKSQDRRGRPHGPIGVTSPVGMAGAAKVRGYQARFSDEASQSGRAKGGRPHTGKLWDAGPAWRARAPPPDSVVLTQAVRAVGPEELGPWPLTQSREMAPDRASGSWGPGAGLARAFCPVWVPSPAPLRLTPLPNLTNIQPVTGPENAAFRAFPRILPGQRSLTFLHSQPLYSGALTPQHRKPDNCILIQSSQG